MELIDTPNPNAKKILINHAFSISEYLNKENINQDLRFGFLLEINEISSIFTGPGFITIMKNNEAEWDLIKEDIKNNFDKL
jgi:hypothetical protein